MNGFGSFFIVVCSISLVSCGSINLNVGESDYRVASGAGGKLTEKYHVASQGDLGQIIAKDDSVALILKQAFLKTFSERLERVLSGLQLTTVRGEIAIVATVFEATDGKNLDFSDSFGKRGGRLIYYTPDVRSGGHFLNFSAIPIYGPINYEGGAIGVKLVVLELDGAESAQIKGMISAIAKLGAKAYPPSSPVLATLDAIGSELLSGEQDDLEFHYSFYLYPNTGTPGSPLPALKTGDYVFVKTEPDLTGPDANFVSLSWDNVGFCQRDGRLKNGIETGVDVCTSDDYRERSYMVVNVQSGLPSVGLDTAETFASFEKKIAEAAASRSDLAAFTSNIEKVIDEVQTDLVADKKKDQRRRGVNQSIDLMRQLAALPAGRSRVLAALSLHDSLELRPKFPVDDNGSPEAFDIREIQRLVDTMRSLARDPASVTPDMITQPAEADVLGQVILEPTD